jgi:hypothetical protein
MLLNFLEGRGWKEGGGEGKRGRRKKKGGRKEEVKERRGEEKKKKERKNPPSAKIRYRALESETFRNILHISFSGVQ